MVREGEGMLDSPKGKESVINRLPGLGRVDRQVWKQPAGVDERGEKRPVLRESGGETRVSSGVGAWYVVPRRFPARVIQHEGAGPCSGRGG